MRLLDLHDPIDYAYLYIVSDLCPEIQGIPLYLLHKINIFP